jgi:hypothetical protein
MKRVAYSGWFAWLTDAAARRVIADRDDRLDHKQQVEHSHEAEYKSAMRPEEYAGSSYL